MIVKTVFCPLSQLAVNNFISLENMEMLTSPFHGVCRHLYQLSATSDRNDCELRHRTEKLSSFSAEPDSGKVHC